MLHYRYRPEILDGVLEFGIRPTGRTPPSLVRDFLSDLYRWELRRLRDRLLAQSFPKVEYAARVVALRRRYFLLSVPIGVWTEPRGEDRDGPP